MKHLSFSALLLLVVLITGSCKKIPVINKTNSMISFKVDGAYQEIKGDKSVVAAHDKEEKLVAISGNMEAIGGHQISLLINNFHGVGEYAGEENFLGLYNTPNMVATLGSSEGSIKITEYTEGKSIKGEFQFKGVLLKIDMNPVTTEPEVTAVISEGKFESKITNLSINP